MKISASLLATASIISSVHGQFFGKTEQGSFYSGNHANADISKEKRAIQLSSDEFKEYANTIVHELAVEHQSSIYNTWKERGSLFLEDGATPIVENENFGESSVDPRVPIGFGNPLVQRNFDIFVEDPVSPYVLEALNDDVPMESIKNGWILVESIGRLYNNNMQPDIFLSILEANRLDSGVQLIRIVCESCVASHKEVFYRRISPVPTDMLDIIRKDWRSSGNGFGTDFKLYSTYNDAVGDTNAWTYCGGFDVKDEGFPGTCGPSAQVEDQWINMERRNGQPDVAIFVQDPTAPADVFVRASWEVELENHLVANPSEAKARGLCWHLPLIDSRRECWWACKYGESTNNLGALKLCLNLRHKGQVWKSKDFAIDSEAEEGLQQEQKIKLTHALGSDEGLPSLGTD